jgi:superfamily II DNA/RNA helicase
VEELNFSKPAIIQAVAIPLILSTDEETETHQNLIAQSNYGSGKTGAFTIGSVLRVEPKILKPQVLCIVHFRELAIQITEVYRKITKFTDIKVADFCEDDNKWEGHQIIVTTLGKLLGSVQSRKNPIDLSNLKMVIIDEANVFFIDERN